LPLAVQVYWFLAVVLCLGAADAVELGAAPLASMLIDSDGSTAGTTEVRGVAVPPRHEAGGDVDVEKNDPTVGWGAAEADEERTVSLGIVVVRCEESLEWVQKLGEFVPPPFYIARVHVVEKCPGMHAESAVLHSLLRGPHSGAPPPLVTVTNLKNVGAELYGYVTHIIDYYEHVEDYTAFLSGSPNATFDLCNFAQFMQVAVEREYAGLGFKYGQGSTNGFVLMDSCPGRGVPLHDAGVTVGIYGSQFIASRSAIHFSRVEVFREYRKCFESLPEVRRPRGIKRVQWDEVAPGAAECAKWEQHGHMLFGMPRVLPDQKVLPCTDRPSTTYPALVMPLLSVLPLWSPFRLLTMCLALIMPIFLTLWLCNPSQVGAKQLTNSAAQVQKDCFHGGFTLESPVDIGS